MAGVPFYISPRLYLHNYKEVSLWVRKQFVTLMAADAGERRQELLHFIFKFMGIKTIIYGNTDTEDTVRR